jgi:hypothetical protein
VFQSTLHFGVILGFEEVARMQSPHAPLPDPPLVTLMNLSLWTL